MTEEELRAQIAAQIEAEIRPLIRTEDGKRGEYNCCGCSTYYDILDHAIRIAKGEQDRGVGDP